jgi:hypothetical protein
MPPILVGLQRLDAPRRGIDRQIDRHLVDDAGRLESRVHRHEAALAQVDDVAAHAHPAVVALGEHHRERAGVERMSGDGELHGGGCLPDGRTVRAVPAPGAGEGA